MLVAGTAGIYVVKNTDLITKDTGNTTFVEESRKDNNKLTATEQSKNRTIINDKTNEMVVSLGSVEIVNPTEGQVFKPGDTVNVDINVSNKNALVLITTSTAESALLEHAPYKFQFVIPNETTGSLSIAAEARDYAGTDEEELIGSDEITIKVIGSATLTDIKIYPEYLVDDGIFYAPVGLKIPLTIYGVYSGGVERKITSSDSGTSYTSSNPSVVNISPEGFMTSETQGEAVIKISNSGVIKELRVKSERPPDL